MLGRVEIAGMGGCRQVDGGRVGITNPRGQEVSVGERALGELLDRAHTAGPDRVAGLVARAARMLGLTEAVLYLVDYDQRCLVPVQGEGVPARDVLGIDSTMAGRAFRSVQPFEADAPAGRRLWVPMLDGTERVGVLEVLTADVDGLTRTRCRYLAALAAELVITKGLYGDVFIRVQRRGNASLASEIQWNLLPPLTLATDHVVISGILQPCYDVGGDTFDYALNGDVAHVAMFDAMGHGLTASLVASVAAASYRHSRRVGLDLGATLDELDRVIAAEFGPDRFATGLLGELDCRTGQLCWISAGHPGPLIVRGNKVVANLEPRPTLPLGFGDEAVEPPVINEDRLEPGDRLLLYTDGVIEARSDDGDFFGLERLADHLVRETAAGLPAPETMRRLSHAILAHQQGQLQDDATTLFVEWRGGLAATDPRSTMGELRGGAEGAFPERGHAGADAR